MKARVNVADNASRVKQASVDCEMDPSASGLVQRGQDISALRIGSGTRNLRGHWSGINKSNATGAVTNQASLILLWLDPGSGHCATLFGEDFKV